MNKDNFSNLTSSVNQIFFNINNINSYLNNFNKSFDEIELNKIDNELDEIKKILDANKIDLKNPEANEKYSLLSSIDDQISYLKNNLNKNSKTK